MFKNHKAFIDNILSSPDTNSAEHFLHLYLYPTSPQGRGNRGGNGGKLPPQLEGCGGDAPTT